MIFSSNALLDTRYESDSFWEKFQYENWWIRTNNKKKRVCITS